MAEERRSLGDYAYAGDLQGVARSGALDRLDLQYLTGAGACVLGTPDQCLEACRRYEAAGVDLLLCLLKTPTGFPMPASCRPWSSWDAT